MDQNSAMNTTMYSQQEITEARQGLKLLKERMNNLGMGKRTSQSGHRERTHYNNSYAGSSGTAGSQSYAMPHIQSALPNNNRRSQYGGNPHHTQSANKPPMIPHASQVSAVNDVMNTSSLSGVGNTSSNALGRGYSGPAGTTPRSLGTSGNSNYRRAFKPQLTPANNTSASAAFSTLNSDERLGGGGHQGGGKEFYENPIRNRQSLHNKMAGSDQRIHKPQTFYEPSRRSPNMAPRQIQKDSDQSASSAFGNSRLTPHQQNSTSYDNKYGDQFSGGNNYPTPTNQRRVPLGSGQNSLQQSRDMDRSAYQPGSHSQNGPGTYDSRKYSGPPGQNQRQMAQQPEGNTRSTNSYRQPNPLKNLKQSMDISAAKANDGGPDPFASKSRVENTPPQGQRTKPITTMKQQPKQNPQAGGNPGGHQGHSGGYGDEFDNNNMYDQNNQGGYQNQSNYNSSPQEQFGSSPQEPTEFPPDHAGGGGGAMDRVACQFCARKFAPESIEKHERICQKTHNQKRKQFNTKDQRSVEAGEKSGTMNEYTKPFGLKKTLTKRGGPGGASQVEEAPAAKGKKMPKWKIQSLQFRQAMMASGGDLGGATTNGFRPTQEMSQLDEIGDDRIQCKFCSRKFNEEAGKRHFVHCEAQYKKNMMKNGGGNKKQQTKRGTQVGFTKKKY